MIIIIIIIIIIFAFIKYGGLVLIVGVTNGLRRDRCGSGWGGNGQVDGAAGVARLGWRGWGGAVGVARLGWHGWSGKAGVARLGWRGWVARLGWRGWDGEVEVEWRSGWRSGIGGNAVEGAASRQGGVPWWLATWRGWGGAVEAGRALWRLATWLGWRSGDGWGSSDGLSSWARGAGVDGGGRCRDGAGAVGLRWGALVATSYREVSWPSRGGRVRVKGQRAEVAAKSFCARESGRSCPIEMMSQDGDNGMASVHTREGRGWKGERKGEGEEWEGRLEESGVFEFESNSNTQPSGATN
ncbi:hypothetical protein EDB84DRAFT_1447626 [Lactarius hengduanensis]|nr:hypothetical protein EDB84DRAFT_1447626 [Lactarius hengduanensis]